MNWCNSFAQVFLCQRSNDHLQTKEDANIVYDFFGSSLEVNWWNSFAFYVILSVIKCPNELKEDVNILCCDDLILCSPMETGPGRGRWSS